MENLFPSLFSVDFFSLITLGIKKTLRENFKLEGFFFKIFALLLNLTPDFFLSAFQNFFYSSKNSFVHFILLILFIIFVNKFLDRTIFKKYTHLRARGIPFFQPYDVLYSSTVPLLSSISFFGLIKSFFLFFRLSWFYSFTYFKIFLDFLIYFEEIEGRGYSVTQGLLWYIFPYDGWIHSSFLLKGNLRYILKFLFSSSFLIFFCILISYLWTQGSTSSPEYHANQLIRRKISIPGYRLKLSIMQNSLQNFLNPLSFLSGFLIGVTSVLFGIFGVFGAISSQLVLISILIFNSLLKRGARERIEEFYPHLKDNLI